MKQWFAKLNQEAKERRNLEKPYLYVKPAKLRKKVADHQKKQREAQKKPARSDYEHSLVKSAQQTRKRVGKGVPQLEKVSKPMPPLIMPNQYDSNEDLMPKQSLILSELDSLEHYFRQSGLNIEDIIAIAGRHTFEKAQIVDQWRARYEPSRSLMNPQHLHELGTQMYAINKLCMEASNRGDNWISVRIRQHHYFRGNDIIYVQFEELHQLCHLDALNKSLVSCFCL